MYIIHTLHVHVLYTGKYSPLFYFCPFRSRQRANLRLGELFITNNISVNTTASGRIQDGAKLLACVKGRK